VILLPQTDTASALRVANRICESVRTLEIVTRQGVQRLSVSIGVATFPANGRILEDLLFTADMALFAAKDAGRDQVQVVPT